VVETSADIDALGLATELTVAWLSNPNTRAGAEDVPAFLGRIHGALGQLSSPQQREEAPAKQDIAPAVSVRKSLSSPEHIISLIDGKPYKTLRRHLARHGMTPEQYRERFGLKPDYPMVSEAYSQVRRAMAQKIGLGRKARNADETSLPPAGETKPRRGPGRRKATPAE
jgi:predicted transcriptional regulator